MSARSPGSQIRPQVSFWQIWNMCFGFLGIQFGFALQNANVSRIFQTLGAEIEDIPMLWIAAPLTGLIVQPIVGYWSDRTWTRLGRRRPFFLVGAILASLALFVMPQSPTLWVLDASINISMEPFRALVGDQLPQSQRARGYAMQSLFIGLGAIVASALPWLLTKAGVANTAEPGIVPDAVRWSFWAGAAVLLAAVGWTVLRTREMPPEQLAATDSSRPYSPRVIGESEALIKGACWIALAGLIATVVALFQLDPALYLLAAGLACYGVALLVLSAGVRQGMFATIMGDLYSMPDVMRRLALVQFFSWFALFAMWIYTTAAVTSVHFNATTGSQAWNDGADWVGVLFGAYNGFAALAAIGIPWMVRRIGMRTAHLINLWIGAAAFLSFHFIRDPDWLLLSMVGIGIAWASILSLPYALLADSLPANKMGVYMGIFNFFIVIPQLVAATVLGFLLSTFFNNEPIHALSIGAASLVIAGLCMLRVRLEQDAPAGVSVTV